MRSPHRSPARSAQTEEAEAFVALMQVRIVDSYLRHHFAVDVMHSYLIRGIIELVVNAMNPAVRLRATASLLVQPLSITLKVILLTDEVNR
jgi:hypothetical protein